MPMSSASGLSPGDKPENDPPPMSAAPGSRMSAKEFAEHFCASSRVLWLISVGIVGDAGAAEDVLQDAAMVALRKLDQFRPGTSFQAWVGAIVRNVALNAVRTDRRRRNNIGEWPGNSEAFAAGTHGSKPSPSAAPVLDTRIAAALADLGDVARACLLLRAVGDLQYSQISALLEIPEGTAMSHVHRARNHLRDRLVNVWKEHSGETEP